MRNSRQNPQLSAYTHMYGIFDFNKTPIAPPGTKAVIFEDPDTRASWGPHGKIAWYVQPALEHYRNYTFYIPETGGVRNSASVQFFPYYVTMPRILNVDAITIAADDLVQALLKPEAKKNLNMLPKHYEALK